jgi:DNA-binding HxlR family transcriptional regulator
MLQKCRRAGPRRLPLLAVLDEAGLEAADVLTRLSLRHNTRAYALTDRGLALREAIVALGRWGAEELRT